MPTKNNRLHQQTDLGVRLVELKSLALKILAVEPKNTDALNSLGLISMQLELFDEAVSFFEQAHNILPDRQDYIDNLIQQKFTWFEPLYEIFDRYDHLKRDYVEALPSRI